MLDGGDNGAAIAAAVSVTVVSAALIIALVVAVIILAVLFRRNNRVQEYEVKLKLKVIMHELMYYSDMTYTFHADEHDTLTWTKHQNTRDTQCG